MELATLEDQSAVIQDLQSRIQKQQSDCDTTQMRLRFLQETSAPKETVAQLEAKIRELEGRMSFEVASKARAEVPIFTSFFYVYLLHQIARDESSKSNHVDLYLLAT